MRSFGLGLFSFAYQLGCVDRLLFDLLWRAARNHIAFPDCSPAPHHPGLGRELVLSALGVFLRDVSQFIGIVTTVLMFMSPIFYSATSLPERYRDFLHLSPLTVVVEQARNVLFWGVGIEWRVWFLYTTAACLIAILGYAWFQRTRKGFADVL